MLGSKRRKRKVNNQEPDIYRAEKNYFQRLDFLCFAFLLSQFKVLFKMWLSKIIIKEYVIKS